MKPNPTPISFKFSITLSFLLFVVYPFASASSYYVSKSGNDTNAGTTAATSKLTILAATNLASANDVVYIGTGYYAETVRLTKSLQFFVDSVRVNVVNMSSAGITLKIDGNANEKSFNVKDSMVLNNGLIKIGSSLNAFRVLAGCIMTAGNKGSYVDGRIYYGLASGSTTIDFPIGKGSDFRAVKVSFTKSNNTLTYYWFEMYSGAAPNSGSLPTGIRNYSDMSYFQGGTLPANAGNSSAFTVTLRYDTIAADDGVYDNVNLRVIGYSGTNSWTDFGGIGSAIRKGQIATTVGFNVLGIFTLSNKITLTSTERKSGYNVLGSKQAFAAYKFSGRCSNDTLKFVNLSKSYSAIQYYKWNFGDPISANNTSSSANPVHKFSGSGSYRIALEILNADNFIDSWVQIVFIYASPDIFWRATNVCIGEATTFTDYSVIASGETINAWSWNLGDLPSPNTTIKSGKTVVFTYPNAGVFKVILKATTTNNCMSRDTFDYLVHDKPTPTFDAKNVCLGQASIFDDQSTVAIPDGIASRKWNLGDGFSSTSKTFSRKYAAAGVYNVKLISYSNYIGTKGACRDSLTKPIVVFSLPVIDYAQSNTCLGVQTIFTDYSKTDPADFASTYSWIFGDGNFDTTMYTAAHTYAKAGSFVSRLTVLSSAGCVGTDTLTVFVQPNPVAKYTVKEQCFGDSTQISRIAQLPASLELKTSYTWLFDSTLRYFNKIEKIKFSAPGAHSVLLLAKTSHGCIDSARGNVMSHYLPTVRFGLDTSIRPNDSIQCFRNNNFSFTFSVAIDPLDTIANSAWYWGNGKSESPAISTKYSFADSGQYRVKLYGWSVFGCADSASNRYLVNPSPSAKFYHSGICVPDSIAFYDTATKSSLPITGRKWDFGFATRTSKAPFKQYYSSGGPQVVSYIVTNNLGCSDTNTQNLNFIQRPILNFSYLGSMPLCKGDSIDITASGGDTIKWLVDNSMNPSHKFYGKGWYKVKASSGICSSVDSVQVKAFPQANIMVFSDTTIFRGKKAQLIAKGALTYKWKPNDGTLNIDSGFLVIARPLKKTTYYVSGVDSNGCADNDSVVVTIIDPPLLRIPNIITPNSDNENDFWDLTELADIFLFDIKISDRQGKLLYQTNDYKNDWKALDRDGNDLPPGIYFYYMKNRYTGQEIRGYIQVIR